MIRLPHATFAALIFLSSAIPISSVLSADGDMKIVEKWLGSNSGIRSIKVNFSQTRTMKTLKVPVSSSGTLWVDYGSGKFRWQTGNPPKTLVTGKGSDIVIVRPPAKKYERRRGGSGSSSGMAAMPKNFPRSVAEFKRKYRLLSVDTKSSSYEIKAQPLGSAGRGVNSFTFKVEKDKHRLLGMSISMKDGSWINTRFTNVQPNAPTPSSLFTPDLKGYKETSFSKE